jgi:cytochrome c oxidase subunit 2
MWGLIGISLAVVAIITVLVLWGVLARRVSSLGPLPEARRGDAGLAWIWSGLTVTTIALVFSLVWTVVVLAKINSPPTAPALAIEVTGHQWWWEARYAPDNPSATFVTANELHIPVGAPVLLRLKSADVIHSFWVPSLMGKTDTIPGRTNITWLQAERPGIYRGQCTEYCGRQHAGMAVSVVAQRASDFGAWLASQQAPAAPASASVAQGAALFNAHCGACHTVRGSEAAGAVGPDLTHLMTRATLASGLMPNTPGGLAGWVANPQAIKPGARMPAAGLSGPQLNAVVAYLESLK